jgi:uncharacterized membrane protein YdbT with pleckstrin-like domain
MINKRLLKKIWLKNDELPIAIIRSSCLNWFWSWTSGLIFIVFGGFLMYFLLVELGWYGIAIFFTLVVIGLIVIFRAYWSWYFTGWILTNLRLIDIYQKGFFGRETSEIIYNQIREVHSKSSGLSGILGMGDLYLKLESDKVKFKLSRVRGVDRAVSEILLQQENYQKNLIDIKENEALRLLDKLKRKLGKEVFDKLIAD